jgi:hypothetical protein
MKATIVAAVAVGVVVGLMASSFKQSEAQGQGEQKKQEWEYKVVAFGPPKIDKDKEQIDKLAAEGWEYVGLLSAGSNTVETVVAALGDPGRGPIAACGSVLFKRAKR